MTGLSKMMSVLDLFQDKTDIRYEDVMAYAGGSRATAYRYLRTLTECGLLSQASGNRYTLGPRVVEMDYLLRKRDPFLTIGGEELRQVSEKTGLNMLLCSFHHDKVLCVDSVWPDAAIPQDYERGRPMPMFVGAMGKVILANLSAYQLKNVMLKHADEIKAAGLGENWSEFRANMTKIRKEKTCVTHGEITKVSAGVAAPVVSPDGRVLGSIVFAIPNPRLSTIDLEIVRKLAFEAAARITLKMTGASDS